MAKKYLKDLMRKMSVLPIILMAVMSVGLASCGSDEKEDDKPIVPPPAPTNVLTISNNSSYSFRPLYVVYMNSIGEPLSTENIGDLLPNQTKTATFPQGTANWYLATETSSGVSYTANHSVTETSFTITAATIWFE